VTHTQKIPHRQSIGLMAVYSGSVAAQSLREVSANAYTWDTTGFVSVYRRLSDAGSTGAGRAKLRLSRGFPG
jgi:hypothetical protein